MIIHLLALGLALSLCLVAPALAAMPFAPGEMLPPLELTRPRSPDQAAQLGLPPGKGPFQLGELRKPLLLVEVFNMYCTICQGEALRVNELYKLLDKSPLKDELAMLGIGVGNSQFEVDVFRKKYSIAFPLFSDGDYAIHKLLREPRTPYFILLKVEGAHRVKVLSSHLGPFGQPIDFLETIKQSASQK